MKRGLISTVAAAAGLAVPATAVAQSHPTLHVNPRWEQCSFQLDSSLTQTAWHQFSAEAGLVTYFRPLSDAAPLGRGNFEVSILQWQTGIDDADAAWNDTFVHPDSMHWLFEGPGLKFPGLMVRVGVADRVDVGAYATKSIGANYGFYGGQVQYNLLRDRKRNWAAASRLSFVSLYGPDDLTFTVYGLDLLASRSYRLFSTWSTIAPYAGVSTHLSRSHERSAAVSLRDESIVGVQGMVGALTRLGKARLGVEYNVARVPTFSLKVGVGL